MALILLIHGVARSGKDTFYEFTKEYAEPLGYRVIRDAFADDVKKYAYEFGWNGEKDDKGRKGLVWLGEGVKEHFDRYFWADRVVNRMILLSQRDFWHSDIYCITDWRFLDEGIRVQEWAERNNHTVVTIKIIRPNFDNGLPEDIKKGRTESELKDYNFDYYIENTTLEEYREKVHILLRFLLQIRH
jgi:hypothetical protein